LRNNYVSAAFLSTFVSFAAGCVTFVSPTHTRFGQFIGVIQEPTTSRVRIATPDKQLREIQVDAETRYGKWITHQPWTIDTIVDASALTVGRCVKVTPRKGNLHIATRIEISLDKAGDVADPCKQNR